MGFRPAKVHEKWWGMLQLASRPEGRPCLHAGGFSPLLNKRASATHDRPRKSMVCSTTPLLFRRPPPFRHARRPSPALLRSGRLFQLGLFRGRRCRLLCALLLGRFAPCRDRTSPRGPRLLDACRRPAPASTVEPPCPPRRAIPARPRHASGTEARADDRTARRCHTAPPRHACTCRPSPDNCTKA